MTWKQYGRSFIKLIHNYEWDFLWVWDLLRLRITCDSIWSLRENLLWLVELSKKDNLFESIQFIDKIWDFFSIWKKESWYKDIKINWKLKSWGLVEMQVHFNDMLRAKNIWTRFDKQMKTKLESEEALLTEMESLAFIEHFYKVMKSEIPLGFLVFITDMSDEFYDSIKINPLVDNSKNPQISWDKIYDLRRSFMDISGNSKNLSNKKKKTKEDSEYFGNRTFEIKWKLERIERLVFDKAWVKPLLTYIEDDLWIEIN